MDCLSSCLSSSSEVTWTPAVLVFFSHLIFRFSLGNLGTPVQRFNL